MKSGVTANQLWSQVPLASRTVSLGAGAAGTIKSIQRGTLAITYVVPTIDATLSPAVVMANTELRWLGTTLNGENLTQQSAWMTRMSLESTTVVRMTRTNVTSFAGASLVGGWEITEWY